MNNGSFFTGLSLFFLGQRGEGIFAVVEMVSSGSVCLTMILEGNCEIFCERRGRGRGGANYLKKKKKKGTRNVSIYQLCKEKGKEDTRILNNRFEFLVYFITLRLKRLQDIFFLQSITLFIAK